MLVNDIFRRFAHGSSRLVGSAWAFLLAVLLIVVWIATGPVFGFSDTWQLVINTSTTIVTFLIVFLIQNTQNRDATAIHLKLDELIRAVKGARNSLVDLEDLSDEQLETLHKEFIKLAQAEAATERIVSTLERRRSRARSTGEHHAHQKAENGGANGRAR